MPPERQGDLKRDQDDDGDFQGFHAVAAGLLDQEVVDVADGFQLAADRLLPAAEVEAARGQLEDAGEIMVADQLECVVDALEEAGGLDLHLANLPHGVAVGLPARQPRATAAIGADQPVGGFKPVVEPVVDVAELE